MKPLGKDRYSFQGVCDRLKKRKYDNAELASDIKLLIGVANCFITGTAVTAAAASDLPAAAGVITIPAVIKAISQKDKILDAAKRVIELLKENTPLSYKDKYERMEEVYTFLWIASFFDTFAETVPKDILDKINLASNEKKAIADQLLRSDCLGSDNQSLKIEFPDSVHGISHVYDSLKEIYILLSDRLREFISCLAFYEKLDEKNQRILDIIMQELPSAALQGFKDQYLTLLSSYPDFAAYIDIKNDIKNDEKFAEIVRLIIKTNEDQAKGFQDLEKAMLTLKMEREESVKRIIDHIKEKYKNAVERPIVETDNTEELIYPPITEAFVPQQFKLLEYTSKDMHLEWESQWNDCESQKDMMAFWAKYIADVQSPFHLLLILGDPGSGKTLLTEMISAVFSSGAELVVRIPLRRYINMIGDASVDDIETMICKQIEKDGDSDKEIRKYKEIVGEAPERPATLIFDGYDEVQQATGLPYASFLNKLIRLQEECLTNNRPVRIIVTSRRTLIDKANIPIGTVVMKLLPFISQQKKQWIETWNKHNHKVLLDYGLDDFRLPENNRDIDELSCQPLLLLMLAIYDADFDAKTNALKKVIKNKNESFNRMQLYDRLIHRFIVRELQKGRKGEGSFYEDATTGNQNIMVEEEMKKLGIAALGMFVRRRSWIKVSELNADFKKLNAKADSIQKENTLEAEEIFLGSFFFIHDSRNYDKRETETVDNRHHEKNASYVFLHRTFYEFLVVDYILYSLYKRIITQTSHAKILMILSSNQP